MFKQSSLFQKNFLKNFKSWTQELNKVQQIYLLIFRAKVIFVTKPFWILLPRNNLRFLAQLRPVLDGFS